MTHRLNRYLLCTAAVVLLSLTGARSAKAGQLLGDTVHVAYHYPDLNTIYQDYGNGIVTSNPATTAKFTESYPQYNGTNNLTLAVDPASIIVSALGHNVDFDYTATFNGFVMTDLTKSPITGVTLGSTVDVDNFAISDVSFTSDSVSINFANQTFFHGDGQIELDLHFAATPAPSSLVMSSILLGIFGVVWSYKRLKQTAIAA